MLQETQGRVKRKRLGIAALLPPRETLAILDGKGKGPPDFDGPGKWVWLASSASDAAYSSPLARSDFNTALTCSVTSMGLSSFSSMQ